MEGHWLCGRKEKGEGRWWRGGLLAAAVALTGCAALPFAKGEREMPPAAAAMTTSAHPSDPWEQFNRAVFAFNEAVDEGIIRPLAELYDRMLPLPVQRGVSNFFSNLADPWIGVNNLLQGKVGDAFSDWLRFGVNSVFGVFGVFDVASEANLLKHNEDFGQTLARWGVAEGPYVVLPLLGPRTLRDALAWPVDRFGRPVSHLADTSQRWTATAVETVAVRAQLLATDVTTVSAPDRYAFVRDAYLQRRWYLVHDGNPPVMYERFE
ncbi:MAG: VacJ family lipoprotein [Hydrogenophilus sp.]|nr:VacJ family lipoprotein [Hydrogenophilus sp.]